MQCKNWKTTFHLGNFYNFSLTIYFNYNYLVVQKIKLTTQNRIFRNSRRGARRWSGLNFATLDTEK